MATPRTYLQRGYVIRPRAEVSPIMRGMEVGKALGTDVGTLLQAVQQQRDQQRLNDVANQLMNTQNAPRATLVSPGTAQYDPVSDMVSEEGLGDQFQTQAPGQPNVIPQGVSTVGTAPITGGLAEYKLRQAFQQQQLQDQLRQAQIANQLAQATGTGRYAPKPAGPSANQQAITERMARNQAVKQAFAEQKANSDSVGQVYEDFNKIHGKGTAAEVYSAIQNGTGFRGRIVNNPDGTQSWVGDANGPLFTTDPRAGTHDPHIDKDFKTFNMNELNSYNQRLQTIQQQGSGGSYKPALRAQPAGAVGAPAAAAAPPMADTGTDTTDTTGADTTGTDTTDTSGDTAQANLPQPVSLDDYKAIPVGSLFIDGDGLTKRKYTV